jgi:hypothetical protein
MNTHATREEVPFLRKSEVDPHQYQRNCYETVFSVGTEPRLYNEVPSPTEVQLKESPELALGRIIAKRWQRDNWQLEIAAESWIETSGGKSWQAIL